VKHIHLHIHHHHHLLHLHLFPENSTIFLGMLHILCAKICYHGEKMIIDEMGCHMNVVGMRMGEGMWEDMIVGEVEVREVGIGIDRH